jgi:hypothetical protein
VQLANEAYSFDNGATRQAGNQFAFTGNQTVYVAVKDVAGNIATGSITISTITSTTRAACETDPIIIGNFAIASCNVGASEAGTGEASYGSVFQWGNNYGFPST